MSLLFSHTGAVLARVRACWQGFQIQSIHASRLRCAKKQTFGRGHVFIQLHGMLKVPACVDEILTIAAPLLRLAYEAQHPTSFASLTGYSADNHCKRSALLNLLFWRA